MIVLIAAGVCYIHHNANQDSKKNGSSVNFELGKNIGQIIGTVKSMFKV